MVFTSPSYSLTWNWVLASITTDVKSPVLLPLPEPTPEFKKSPEHLKSTRTLTPEPNVGLLSRREAHVAD